jgi:hypothetical protein
LRRVITALATTFVCTFVLLAVPAAPAATADGIATLRGTITFQHAPAPYAICLYRLDASGNATGRPTCDYFRTPEYAMYPRSGSYLVSFEPREGYANQLHGLQPGDRRVDASTPVSLGADAPVDLDFDAVAFPVVSGRVTGPDGAPVPDGTVRAVVQPAGPDVSEFWDEGVAVRDSAYRIEVDAPGRYVVRFLDETSYQSYLQPDRQESYATQFWPRSWSWAGARSLSLGWGDTVSGVDVELNAGGEIRGRLIDPRGHAPATVGLLLQRRISGSWEQFKIDSTPNNGLYRARGVPPGTYRFRLNGWGVYENGFTEPVVVASPGTVVRRNIVLAFTRPPQVAVERRPRLAGTPAAGRTLRVVGGAYSPRRATITYRWYADGRRLRAHRARLVLAPRWRGARIRVEVSAKAPTMRSRTVTLRTRVAR